jgi:hypothetical protein
MRDEQLPTLRPDLGLDTQRSTPDEVFQNQTLRPILKLQHPLLVAVFGHYLAQHKNTYRNLPRTERPAWIAHTLRSNLRLRSLLTGLVIGHFTAAEWAQFVENEPERMRRLVNLLVQRLQSVADELAAEAVAMP